MKSTVKSEKVLIAEIISLGSLIPFRGDASKLIPEFLKGQTKSLLAICKK